MIDTRTSKQKWFDTLNHTLYELCLELLENHNWDVRTCTIHLTDFEETCGTFVDNLIVYLDFPRCEIDRLIKKMDANKLGVSVEFFPGHMAFVKSAADAPLEMKTFYSTDATLVVKPVG